MRPFRSSNPCTICGKPGIPGLVRGYGKCQYHWDVCQFGQEWADRVRYQQELREGSGSVGDGPQ